MVRNGHQDEREVTTTEEYAELLTGLFDARRAGTEVVGLCSTQVMDTGQETDGRLFADGTPKLPVEQLFRIVTGRTDVELPFRPSGGPTGAG